MQPESSSNPRRLLPAALATLVIGTAGVLVILTMVPPGASSPSAALGGQDSGSGASEGKAGSNAAASPGERAPFTSPAAPVAEGRQETSQKDATSSRRPALAGRVVNSDEKPISRALIKLARTDGPGPRNATTRTDATGEFTIRDLSPGTWRLAATARGYRPRAVSVEAPRAEPLELVLEDDRGLEVSVTDSDGAPVGGARVTLRVRSHSLPGHRSGSTTAAGTVTLSGIAASGPEWSGKLMVHHGDYLPLERSITTDDLDRGELQLVLAKGGELHLKIVSPEGEPVSGALVNVFQEDARQTRRLRSVSSGEVLFRNLRPGDYTASVTTNRDGQAVARGLTVVAGPAPGARELPLVRGAGSLTIRAIAHDGEALPLCAVRLTPSNAPDGRGTYRDGVTDKSGICRFEALDATSYDVEVGGRKFTRARRAAVPADGREIVLNVDRPGSIAGRVELPQVKGGYAIRVSGSRTADGTGKPYERIVRFSAARRAFTLRYMPPGTYTLDLLVDGKTVATVEGVEVEAGEKTEGVTFGAGEG